MTNFIHRQNIATLSLQITPIELGFLIGLMNTTELSKDCFSQLFKTMRDVERQFYIDQEQRFSPCIDKVNPDSEVLKRKKSPFKDCTDNEIYEGDHIYTPSGEVGTVIFYAMHENEDHFDNWRINFGNGEVFSIEESLKKFKKIIKANELIEAFKGDKK